MLNINGKKIGVTEKPYIIAELSANHGGQIENAKDCNKKLQKKVEQVLLKYNPTHQTQ